MARYTQIYLPVTHSNGKRLVQIATEDGRLCGWADGAEKYDYVWTWEIDEDWAPEQAGELGQAIQALQSVSRVTIATDGVARKVTSHL
mgnify:CR=1 FL=1